MKALRDHAELTLKTILWQAPTAPGAGMRAGPGSPERAVALGSRGPITPDVGIFPAVHLEIVQRQFERGSLSRQLVEGHAIPHQLLTTWNNWSYWCIPEHADPAISPSIAKVLDFLSSLINDGKAYRIVKIIATQEVTKNTSEIIRHLNTFSCALH